MQKVKRQNATIAKRAGSSEPARYIQKPRENKRKSSIHNVKSVIDTRYGANDVDIYNSLALLTIDIIINQVNNIILHFNKMQYQFKFFIPLILLLELNYSQT